MSLLKEEQKAKKTYISRGIIWKLEACKKELGSWEEVARTLNVPIRTIHRWRKRQRISDSYRRIVMTELEKRFPQIL